MNSGNRTPWLLSLALTSMSVSATDDPWISPLQLDYLQQLWAQAERGLRAAAGSGLRIHSEHSGERYEYTFSDGLRMRRSGARVPSLMVGERACERRDTGSWHCWDQVQPERLLPFNPSEWIHAFDEQIDSCRGPDGSVGRCVRIEYRISAATPLLDALAADKASAASEDVDATDIYQLTLDNRGLVPRLARVQELRHGQPVLVRSWRFEYDADIAPIELPAEFEERPMEVPSTFARICEQHPDPPACRKRFLVPID